MTTEEHLANLYHRTERLANALEALLQAQELERKLNASASELAAESAIFRARKPGILSRARACVLGIFS